MADPGAPRNPQLEARSRSLGCLILVVLAIILAAIVIALGWRSMWWRGSVPDPPASRLLQEAPAIGADTARPAPIV